jgi:recombination protein U
MIKYPNGQVFNKKATKENKKSNIEISISSANRGMDLENDINISSNYYKDKGIALIYKRPTPINIVKVDYSKGAKITDAYFESQSTTDYNGVYKGRYIDFEAKNTKNKTSFPLANISLHQIEHLKNVTLHGGIAFFIINFESLDETYLLDSSIIIKYHEQNKRKSIPIEEIKKEGIKIKRGYNPRLYYIDAIEEKYFKI